VNHKIVLLAALAALALAPGAAAGATIVHDFDDLAVPPDGADVGTHYPGFLYEGESDFCEPYFNYQGYPPSSGTCELGSMSGVITIHLPVSADIETFTATFTEPSFYGESIHILAYDASGNLLGETQGCVSGYGSYALCGISVNQTIATLVVHDHGNYFSMDSATYGGAAPLPAPELPTLALSALGVVGVAGFVFVRRS
jgi:hypothetical protein